MSKSFDIEKIDKNFSVKTTVSKSDVIWLDASCEPFELYGAAEVNPYCRMPRDRASKVSYGVQMNNEFTSGIRVRFRTDSPYIAIDAAWESTHRMAFMTIFGCSGFDLYKIGEDGKQIPVRPAFVPSSRVETGYQAVADTDGVMTDYVLNFPLYGTVSRLFVGVAAKSRFEEAKKYANALPAVFYGSSITQGGCASRPGNSYQNFLSRSLDLDYINLGFSGNGKGEPEMAEYIAGLPMSVFVSDYDHNAPTVEHLRETHYRFYEIIREKQPELPYIMVSRPNFYGTEDDIARRAVIYESYERARANGDENVYFLDGETVFAGDAREVCTVDGTHPNDLGFYRFAKALEPLISKLI